MEKALKAPAPKLPASLLAMNAIGSIVFAVGLIAVVTDIELPLDGFLPEGYGYVLMTAGILLELPLIKHFVDQARRGGRPKRPGEA